MSLVKDIISPEKVLETESGIKIHLKGVNFSQEQWIESPKVRELKNIEDAELMGAEIFSRLFRCIVRKVEGVELILDGESQPLELQYDSEGIMTMESYTLLMRILNQESSLIPLIKDFYDKTTDISEYISIKKK